MNYKDKLDRVENELVREWLTGKTPDEEVSAFNPLVSSGLGIPPHDEILLSYTGSNLTGVVYKKNSATVATLTLSYTGSNLTSVVKT